MDENELRRLFAELRDVDQQQAPTFAHICARARARRSHGATRLARSLAIGAASVVAVAAIWLARPRPSAPAGKLTIATWRAATDVLLTMPGRDLLGAMPALGTSIVDPMIPTPTKTGALP